jgi:hypothetical protein
VRIGSAFGFIDPQGTLVIEATLPFASDFSEGLAAVLVEGKWGYLNSAGQVVIAPQFDYAADFSEGLAAVQTDGRYGYITSTGGLGHRSPICQRR